MSRPQHKVDPELLEELRNEVQSVYPDLRFYLEKNRIFIRGSFAVIHNRETLDRYAVEIELPPDYPRSVPIVREVGGRIPRKADCHINPNGEVCLLLPDERWSIHPPSSSLLDFLKGPVHNFFLGQSLSELSQPWPFGQWAHGVEGILQYYAGLFGAEDPETILRYLDYLSKPTIKGHWDCPCRSGKRLRDCHAKELQDLRAKIPPEAAGLSREKIMKSLKKS